MRQPPAGISLCTIDDSLCELRATIMGVAGTPYEQGVFKLDVTITERYPYEPPRVRFITPVYHPNIDNNGRICLELLKLPPSGCWRPVITIEGILLAIQSLLGSPNPDDPLMENIAQEYRLNKDEFERNARVHTLKHASQNPINAGPKPKNDDETDCDSVSHSTTNKRKLSEENTDYQPEKLLKSESSKT